MASTMRPEVTKLMANAAWKHINDVAILRLRPLQRSLEHRRKQAEHLAIHTVDRGGGEDQAADDPAHRGTLGLLQCSRVGAR